MPNFPINDAQLPHKFNEQERKKNTMPRATNNVASRKRKKRIFKLAKGYRGARGSLIRSASEAVDRALKYAYRDRRVKKREFRSLWIARVNAAARINNLSYSKLIMGLRKAHVILDRKILADLAVNDPQVFSSIAALAKEHV
jgi:LSU ribosomal protein L20P